MSWGPRRERAGAHGGRLGMPSLQGGFHRAPVLVWVTWAGKGDPTVTAFQECARTGAGPAPPHGTEGSSGEEGQGWLSWGTRGGSLLQALQLRWQVAPRIHAVRHAVLQQRTEAGVLADTRASEPPPPRPPAPPPSGTRAHRMRGCRGGTAHSDENVRVPQHNQQSFGSGDGNVKSF